MENPKQGWIRFPLPIDDDSLHGGEESRVESPDESVGLVALADAVEEALELAVGRGLAHVGAKTGSGEVQRVDDQQRGGPGRSAGRQVAGEEFPEVPVLVDAVHEELLVRVLEGEVERLGGEVPDDVDDVAPPEGQSALLLVHAAEAVHDAVVALVLGDRLLSIL